MSYNIWYRTLFVKVSNEKAIPILEIGCNNLRDACTNKRVREWTISLPLSLRGELKSLPFFSEQELVGIVEAAADELEYCGEKISGQCIMSKRAYANYFKRAFRKAKSFEELADKGIYIEVHDCNWLDASKPHYCKTVNNEKEFIEAWNECIATCGKAICRPCANVSDEQYKRLYPPVQKAKKQHNSGFIVSYHGDYIHKISSRTLWRIPNLAYAKIYTSKAIAQKVTQRILKGWICEENDLQVIPVKLDQATGLWKLSA